ncbi:MAG: membrane protein insertase YidC [Anaeromyxobacter sp.]|nr:membrane protein insertase YidC [Anaeromyxobacter sp.]MBL0278376.1 membrane protein insertase YidC [Anaeromyxobacter sp.]
MGPENRRILIATLASVVILVAWQFIFPPAPPAPVSPKVNVVAPAAAPAGTGPGVVAPVAPAPVPDAPEELVTLTGERFSVVLTSHGGAIARLALADPKFQRDQDGQTVAIDLVRAGKGLPLPLALAASAELGGGSDLLGDPSSRAAMRVVARDARSVTFEGRVGTAAVRKTFRLTGKPYELALELAVTGAPVAGSVAVLYSGFMPPSTSSGGIFSGPPLDFVRPVCRAGDKTERFDVAGDEVVKVLPGAAGWAGIDQHYFTAALFPQPQPGYACTFVKGAEKGGGAVALVVPVAPGGTSAGFLLYAGPKQLEGLKAYGRGFETAIDYGAVANAFAFFAQILLGVMRWFQGFVGNWGVAIILLTLTVKLLLYPLTLKSMQSMAGMRRLQPEIEKLKAKHGDDKQAFAQAQMKLFADNKVSMTGGCLPMLLQMPVWFALYAALQTSVELYREPFLWMSDLTVKDPWFILPVAMGVTSFIMQKLSPQPADNTQAKMMLYFFPGFFTVMMLFVPSGLTLYIFVNNLLSIFQQQLVNKMIEKQAPVKA